MKLASVIEGGLAGATTVSLLSEALRKINGHSSKPALFNGAHLKKRFKKAKSKKPMKATKQFIGLAGDLLGSTAFLGFKPLTKKKNAALRGALLGAAAGLGSVLLNDQEKNKGKFDKSGDYSFEATEKDTLLTKALEVGLFTVGGMIASKMIQRSTKKKKKRK